MEHWGKLISALFLDSMPICMTWGGEYKLHHNPFLHRDSWFSCHNNGISSKVYFGLQYYITDVT